MVVVYGDNQDPFRTSIKDMSDLVDMSSKQDKNNILGISTRSLRTKECYTPATVFTGRT
jgi:ribosomal protein S17E